MQEELSSLRLPDWLKPDGLLICCLKMLQSGLSTHAASPCRLGAGYS